MVNIRSPIITVLGHVDHGKTTLLDKIRGTAIQKKEAGGITQHIGATEIPTKVINELTKPLKSVFKFELKIPGLLFIDTPGHEAFTNLRKRGGSIADFAIIVIDINEGVMPQTTESINICKEFKVPFLVAANKIDRINGWRNTGKLSFLESYKEQSEKVKNILETKIYELVGQLYELGFESERFDRVQDFTRQVAIVPVSAITGEGIAEILLLTAGIVQKFLEKRLKINVEGPAKGVVLEKKMVKGMGNVIDVIVYDGILRKNDRIILMGREGPIITKIRALLKPAPLKELRDKSTKFIEVDQVIAASGVRILAPDLEKALAGSPIYAIWKENQIDKLKKELSEELSEVVFEEDKLGLIVKADTLGTLEAIVKLLKSQNIPVRKADIGKVTKRDIMLAKASKEVDDKYGCILAFNVKVDEEIKTLAESYEIKILEDTIIYRLLEKLEDWFKEVEERKKRKILEELPSPVKIQLLPEYVFRRSNPAIVGVEVISGIIREGIYLMNENGRIVGKVKSVQSEGKSVKYAKKGDRVAISIDGAIIGRNLEPDEILYTYLTEEEFRKYKEYKELLTREEKEILKEIARIMRKNNPTWGI